MRTLISHLGAEGFIVGAIQVRVTPKFLTRLAHIGQTNAIWGLSVIQLFPHGENLDRLLLGIKTHSHQ